MSEHTVEKIGGTSMNDFSAIRDNIVMQGGKDAAIYQRIFVVSAYAGITNRLLEHKKTSLPGVYSLFASSVEDTSWLQELRLLRVHMLEINASFFNQGGPILDEANRFIGDRVDEAERCLLDLHRLCQNGHFELAVHLQSVKEMLASIGEAHSAWNTTQLLREQGVNAVMIDLTGWRSNDSESLDGRILTSFEQVDLTKQLPIVTGYSHSEDGLISSFDRGYSEMTFSRIAVLTKAREAIIHKEFHLCSADPNEIEAGQAVPIGRTNYDVADQLANLGMEAIHPKAAKGLRENNIPLRVKNSFEPEHAGTLITEDYISNQPRVEIIAGSKVLYAVELFDPNMTANIEYYDQEIIGCIRRFRGQVISKDINANTITHYLRTNLKTVKRIRHALEEKFEEAKIDQKEVAIVSAVGSDLQVPGLLAKTVSALADSGISILAIHQSMRQVDIQFVINSEDYTTAVRSLHACLIEVHDHGTAICLAS